MSPVDITGVRFGRLVAVRPTEQRRYQKVVWECRCDCGAMKLATTNELRSGNTKSCGCLNRDVCIARVKSLRKPGVNIQGKRFGRLTAVAPTAERSGNATVWICVCNCGTTIKRSIRLLTRGYTRSCGCLRSSTSRQRMTKHGLKQSGAYSSWRAMIGRCCQPSNISYPMYGGRGITVCNRWRHSFQNFYRDMGPRPEGMTLDRRDSAKGYYPGNCRWATPKEQRANQRINTIRAISSNSGLYS